MSNRYTVVAGFIRTPQAEAALRAAEAETRIHEGRLVIVHSARGSGHEKGEAIIADREALAGVEARMRADGLDVEVRDLVLGNAPEEDILDVAEHFNADLIVIGLRRRTPTGKAVFGSTSQQVLLRAPCPVLAVPAE